jgi:hypothetical protein
MKKLAFALLLANSLMLGPRAVAQESLNLEKAIQVGLDNNLQIKIAVENVNLREGDRKIGAGELFSPTSGLSVRKMWSRSLSMTLHQGKLMMRDLEMKISAL